MQYRVAQENNRAEFSRSTVVSVVAEFESTLKSEKLPDALPASCNCSRACHSSFQLFSYGCWKLTTLSSQKIHDGGEVAKSNVQVQQT